MPVSPPRRTQDDQININRTHSTDSAAQPVEDIEDAKARIKRLSQSCTSSGGRTKLLDGTSGGNIYLVRHGERLDHINPKWRESAQNPFDSPLSDNGKEQARETGARLLREKSPIHRIFCSPFLRTLQTAVGIAREVNCKVCIERSVAEHVLHEHFQQWKARNRGLLNVDVDEFKIRSMSDEECAKLYPKWVDLEYSSFGATAHPESEEDLFQRTNKFVQHLCRRAGKTRENVCVVSHQDPVEYMAHELDDDAQDIFVSYCCLSKAILMRNGGHKLVLQHDDAHLTSPEIPRN